MLRTATLEELEAFVQKRIIPSDRMSVKEVELLHLIVVSREPGSVCPRCGDDLYFVLNGSAYSIWCASHPATCYMASSVRGLFTPLESTHV
jgi:hypothetical protein